MSQKKAADNNDKASKNALGPFADLGPPPDVPSVDEIHILDRPYTKLLPGQVVEPEDGYDVYGPQGLLSRGPGPSNRLLCLADAFEWMRRKELPRKKAVYAVLAPLVQLDEADSGYRRQELYVVNGEDYAHPLFLGEQLNPKARAVWAQLDFAYPDRYCWGVVREIADLWSASWPGYVADPSQFYQDGWRDYCKAMKRLAQSNYDSSDWLEEYKSRYYMTLDDWKDRCKSAVRLLSRLAVPLSFAHELWGWGSVALPDVLPSATAAPEMEAQDVTDWPSLVRYRHQFASLPVQKRPVWLLEHVGILAARLHDECQSGRMRGALGRLAGELGVVRSTAAELLEKRGFNQATGEKLPAAAATPWDGISNRSGKAA